MKNSRTMSDLEHMKERWARYPRETMVLDLKKLNCDLAENLNEWSNVENRLTRYVRQYDQLREVNLASCEELPAIEAATKNQVRLGHLCAVLKFRIEVLEKEIRLHDKVDAHSY